MNNFSNHSAAVTKINPPNCHGFMCSLASVQADLIAYAGVETLLASAAGGERAGTWKAQKRGRRKKNAKRRNAGGKNLRLLRQS